MQTHESATVSTPARTHHAPKVVDGMGRATLTALGALTVCVLLIGVGAILSICWDVQPLLLPVVAALLIWLGTRLAGFALRSGR